MDLVEIVSNVPDAKDKATTIAQRIVLVSDLQEGSRLDVLADYPWPDDVQLELRPVKPSQPTNAGLHRLAERSADESADKPRELRVRVSNDAASAVDQFQLTWLGDGRSADWRRRSRRTCRPARAAWSACPGPSRRRLPQRLRLSGDGCEFDNTLYLATRPQAEMSVVYLGTDAADDPQQPALLPGTRARRTACRGRWNWSRRRRDEPLKLESPTATPLVVVATEPTDEQSGELRKYVEAGGTVLFVLTENSSKAETLAALLGVPTLDIAEADVDKYTMLGQIAFDHPLFAPMAGPHFNDFTQIHFWKYRKLNGEQLGDATVVARFENGDPAVVERRLGKGQVYVLASGWQPSDSQLARSWKFVLLVSALVEGRQAGKSDRVYFVVDEPVPLGEDIEFGGERAVIKPDGEKLLLAADARQFRDTDQPGLYSIESRGRVSPKLEMAVSEKLPDVKFRRESRSGGKPDQPVGRGNAGATRLPAGQPGRGGGK